MLAGLFATSANASIVISAGEWTLDINGNVNAFANYTKAHGGVSNHRDTISTGVILFF
jgi:hypothetical protein